MGEVRKGQGQVPVHHWEANGLRHMGMISRWARVGVSGSQRRPDLTERGSIRSWPSSRWTCPRSWLNSSRRGRYRNLRWSHEPVRPRKPDVQGFSSRSRKARACSRCRYQWKNLPRTTLAMSRPPRALRIGKGLREQRPGTFGDHEDHRNSGASPTRPLESSPEAGFLTRT